MILSVVHPGSRVCFFEARADAMVASPSFSKVPPMKHATLMAFPSAVSVTVSTGGLAALSSLAGTPSKNDLRATAFFHFLWIKLSNCGKHEQTKQASAQAFLRVGP